MNQNYTGLDAARETCFTLAVADFRAEFLARETGISHKGVEISDGIFQAVPIDNAPPVDNF